MWHGYGIWNNVFVMFLIALIIVVIYFIFRLMSQHDKPSTDKQTETIAILQQRLARGEIDESEYVWLKEILREN